MALNDNEKLLVEAMRSMFNQDAKLGLSIHDKDTDYFDAERGLEYLHGHIDEMFTLKAVELIHSESICQAFNKVHSYKYLSDPSFITAMEKEMVAQAVPAAERSKACSFIPKIIDELKNDQQEWCEKDSGWHPSLDEIREISKPQQPIDFNVETRGNYNKQNVTWKRGNASPGKIGDSE